MIINEFNEMLSRDTVHWVSCGYEDVKPRFDVSPHEYLEFMEEDLKESDKRNLINALSNAKRALDCQIESLLYGFCLKQYTDKKKMRIPNKIELLNKLGIIAPRILSKINKVRNTMEHDFYCPSSGEVEDFADVILLFISYTDKYLHEVKSQCEIIDETYKLHCTPEFDRENQKIDIEIRIRETGKENEILTIEANSESIESFLTFLKLYIKLISTY